MRFPAKLILLTSLCLGAEALAIDPPKLLERPLLDVCEAGGALVAVEANGSLLRSSDDGDSFVETFTPDAFEEARAVAANGSTVVAVSEGGIVRRSDDGGRSWNEVYAPTTLATLNDVATDGQGNWIAVGQEAADVFILASSDAGASWTPVAVEQPGELKAVAWVSGGVWLAGGWHFDGGRDGLLLRSGNGGGSWTLASASGDAGPIEDIASDGSQALAVGANGYLGLVDASGTLVSSETATATEPLTAAAALADGSWAAGGVEGLILEVLGSSSLSVSVYRNAEAGQPTVSSISQTSGELLVASEEGFNSPTGEPSIGILVGDGSLVVQARDVVAGRQYTLLQSADLASWAPAGEAKDASSSVIQWRIAESIMESGPVFWKLSEGG